MQKLNLPEYQFRISRNIDNKLEIYDRIRRKSVVLTPEEWVRQNLIEFLINDKGYPPSLISVEKGIKVNNMYRRYDIVAYNKKALPVMLIECKAPEVKISQEVFDQAAAYNLRMKVPFLLVSNGISHYCCHVDRINEKINFMENIPEYAEICDYE